MNNDFLSRDFSLLRPPGNKNTVKFVLHTREVGVIKSQILKREKIDRGEYLQNIEREMQGEREHVKQFLLHGSYI